MSAARRRVLSLSVCSMISDAGLDAADESVIDMLTTIMQSLICEIGRSGQAHAELNSRTEVLVNDVCQALMEMGLNSDSLPEFAEKMSKMHPIPAPGREPSNNQPKILQAGAKRPLHPYIPDYFPPFPDPHSYIRTPTHKQPATEYEAIREKSANQKRDVERALTRFMAKTCESNDNHSLFGNNPAMNKYFPLIAVKKSPTPYLDAIMPRDQIFETDDITE
ncbi:Transcription initiation factor TFIID subunit 8, partial [Fragariocoptes setiger]